MTDNPVYLVPSPAEDNFLELSRSKIHKQQGKLYRKQIFKMGTSFIHPSNKKVRIKVDENLARSLEENFDKSGNIVQVPKVNDLNQHVEDPDNNLGEVLGIEHDADGIYAIIDARKNPDSFGKTYLGASAFMNLNHEDTTSGDTLGPTLLHVAVTNRPYLTNLDDYKEVLTLSADNNEEEPVLLEEETGPKEETTGEKPNDISEAPAETSEVENNKMELEELQKLLDAANEKVSALEAQLTAKTAENVELSAKLDEPTAPTMVKLSGKEITVDELASAFVQLSDDYKSVSETVTSLKEDNDNLKLSAAETEVDKLVSTGFILPKQRDFFVKLSMTDREQFTAVLPDKPIVNVENESGSQVFEVKASGGPIDPEVIADYVERAKALSGRKSNKR